MKLKFIAIIATSVLVFSCKKHETSTETATATSVESSPEESLTQDSKTLTNDKGETVTITYFAKGTDVALRLKKGNEPEHELTAKGTSERGNPIFTDDTYMWEMSQDGMGGTLSDRDKNTSVYK